MRLSQLIDVTLTESANPDLLMASDLNPFAVTATEVAVESLDSDRDSRVFKSSQDSQISDSQTDDDEFLVVQPEVVLTLATRQRQLIEFRFVKLVDKGSYGQVLEYRQKSNQPVNQLPVNICLKVGLRVGDLKHDLKILRALPTDFQSTGLIDSCQVNLPVSPDQTEAIIIMPKMKGDVVHLFRRLKFTSLVEKLLIVNTVLYNISKTLWQLLEAGIYYTDLKLNNCLYQTNNQDIQICLCDLGSAFLKNQKEAMATYPQIYRRKCYNFVPELFDLQYGLMILFFQMMIENVDSPDSKLTISSDEFLQLFHQKIDHLTLNHRQQIIERLFRAVVMLITNNQEISSQKQLVLKNYVKQLQVYLTTQFSKSNEVKQLQEISQFFKTHYTIFSKYLEENQTTE